jgi:hypothetical protein
MGLCFHHRLRVAALPVIAAVTVLTAFFSAAAFTVAPAAAQPCPSCPNQYPPPGSGSGSGSGGAGAGAGQGGQAVPALPLISLAPISVSDGVASVSGSVTAAVGPPRRRRQRCG